MHAIHTVLIKGSGHEPSEEQNQNYRLVLHVGSPSLPSSLKAKVSAEHRTTRSKDYLSQTPFYMGQAVTQAEVTGQGAWPLLGLFFLGRMAVGSHLQPAEEAMTQEAQLEDGHRVGLHGNAHQPGTTFLRKTGTAARSWATVKQKEICRIKVCVTTFSTSRFSKWQQKFPKYYL